MKDHAYQKFVKEMLPLGDRWICKRSVQACGREVEVPYYIWKG